MFTHTLKRRRQSAALVQSEISRGAGALASEVGDIEINLAKILSPRVEGETTKIVNRNGLLKGRGFGTRRMRGGFYF